MNLDLSSLRNALNQVEEALAYSGSDLARSDPKIGRLFRAAAIQAFEFTYEVSWKMLKRYLEASSATPDSVDKMTFADLIRTGNEQGLLKSDWDAWREFRRALGITSHVYDEAKAQEVYGIIPRFNVESRFLLAQLETRAAQHD